MTCSVQGHKSHPFGCRLVVFQGLAQRQQKGCDKFWKAAKALFPTFLILDGGILLFFRASCCLLACVFVEVGHSWRIFCIIINEG